MLFLSESGNADANGVRGMLFAACAERNDFFLAEISEWNYLLYGEITFCNRSSFVHDDGGNFV